MIHTGVVLLQHDKKKKRREMGEDMGERESTLQIDEGV